MIKIDVAGFKAQVAVAVRKQQATCLLAYKGLIGRVYRYVVTETPQWTGTTAGNWRLGVNSLNGAGPDDKGSVVTSNPNGSVYSKNSPNQARLVRAYNAASSALTQIRSLEDKAFIYNQSKWDGKDGASASWIESNPGYFRAVNQPAQVLYRGKAYAVNQPILTGLKGVYF